jgi:hypothetical protein
MTDYFAVLELPRQAWLEGVAIKEQFHRLSAVRHPDAAGGSVAAFSLLNEAWQALRDPAQCLRHFLSLTQPDALDAAKQTPPELGDLFMDIAAVRQAIQKCNDARNRAASPLAKALIEPQRLDALRRLDDIARRLSDEREKDESALRDSATPDFGRILARMTFLGNWERQIGESRATLSL